MISIIAGTNRKNSRTLEIAKIYQEALKQKNVKANLIALEDLPPNFLETALYDNNGKNEAFNQLIAPLAESKKIIMVVPEYNGSLPGILKLFIDALTYPSVVKNRKIALVGLSSNSRGAALAMSHLADILGYLGAIMLPMRMRMPHIATHLVEGKLIDHEIYAPFSQLIDEQLNHFIEF